LENKFILAIDWTKVEAHMAAVKANPFRIKLGKCIPLTTPLQVSWSWIQAYEYSNVTSGLNRLIEIPSKEICCLKISITELGHEV
jgi:hypothetical protein